MPGAISRPLSFEQFANGAMLTGGYRGRVRPDENRTGLDPAKLAPSVRTMIDVFSTMHGAEILRC